jgi:hypothetical protein
MKATFRSKGCGLLYFRETSVIKQFEGDVDFWNEEKLFGFIKYDGKRMFFSGRGVEPDWKGSKGWCFSRGVPVKFEITQRIVGGETKDCAANVVPLFEMSEPENINGYRETSEVLNLNRKGCFAFLMRPCGDVIFLHKNDVVGGYENRWDLLETGAPVFHGVMFDGSTGRWKAANAELYSYNELESFKNETQFAEPEPEPQPAPQVAAPEPEPSVLAPDTKNVPMLKLIIERRVKKTW